MLESYTLCIFCNTEKATNREFYDWEKLNRCRECTKKAKGCSQQERLWANAKQRAYDRKLPFDIDPSDIVIPTHCPVFGIALARHGGSIKMADESASLDKLIPERGYVKGNIAVISMRANRIKNNGTAIEHDKISAWMRARGSERSDVIEERQILV